ncbi:MAG: phosphoribosylformylglycinamidine synthase subunit PurS [Bacteroidetes bacterium]|nr:phosphoribosylformylglycinamidine synthase subunit PurS [Bacteroidota bacterium]
MKYKANIQIMPQAALLDPQGKAVTQGLQQMGYTSIEQVRVGKNITMEVESDTEAGATAIVDESCKKLLANLIMETYSFSLTLI